MWRILRVCSSAKTRLFKSLDSRHLVTAHDIETFQTQGVVCPRGAFREWVEKLKKGIATNHADPSNDRGERIKSEDSQTFYFNDYFNWRRIPEFVGEMSVNEKLYRPRHIWNDRVSTHYRPPIDRLSTLLVLIQTSFPL